MLRAVHVDLLFNVWHTYASITQVALLDVGVGGFLILLFVGGYHLIPTTLVIQSRFNSLVIIGCSMLGIGGPARMLEKHRMGGTLKQLYMSPDPTWVLRGVRSLTGHLTYIPTFAFCLPALRFGATAFTPTFNWSRGAVEPPGPGRTGQRLPAGRHPAPDFIWPAGLGLTMFAVMALSVFHISPDGPITRLLGVLPPVVARPLIPWLADSRFWSLAGVGQQAALTAFHLVAGWFIFRMAERAAKRRGTLLRYFPL